MPRLTLSLTLTFETPPSVGAGGTSGTLADKVVTRDARGGFVVPASQVKGKLRHACEQILRSQNVAVCSAPRPEAMCPLSGPGGFCLLCRLFGSPALPSPLRFHDLALDLKNAPTETLRPMVSLNRQRRVAQEQRLFLIETAPNVPAAVFANDQAITGYVESADQVHLLLAGLKMLQTWGGGGSRGLGWATSRAEAHCGGETITLGSAGLRGLLAGTARP